MTVLLVDSHSHFDAAEFDADRAAVLEHPDYYNLRERLIGFLESQDHRRRAGQAARQRDSDEELEETATQPRLEQALLLPP